MKTAVFTTFYPAMLPYLPAFWDSVQAQTDQDFDLFFGLDRLSQADIEHHIGKQEAVWTADPHLNAIEIRNEALLAACQTHDYIILVDSDDILYPERVSSAKAALEQAALYGCALELIDEAGTPFELRFSTEQQDWTALLVYTNVFGFSNTAYRAELLASCLPVPKTVVMMDWLVATRALTRGARATFDETPRMAYRQYATNTARVLAPYTPAQILRSAELVRQHYDIVLTELAPESAHPYINRQQDVINFLNAMQNTSLLAAYTARLNQLSPVFLWWACVAHPELESLWKTP